MIKDNTANLDLEAKGNKASNANNKAGEVNKASKANNRLIPRKLGMYLPLTYNGLI